MPFCSECGSTIADGMNFCPTCGEKCVGAKQTSERKVEYSGTIHKCPNCGEILESFIPICPSCGYEIRDAYSADSVQLFALKLNQIEASRVSRKGNRLFRLSNEIDATDEKKISLILGFPVPNAKEDVLEFMILASSNIDASVYASGADGYYTPSMEAVSKAWVAKMEQIYQKARLSFGSDKDFLVIQEMYDSAHKRIKKSKGKYIKFVIAVPAILVFTLVLAVALNVFMPKTTEQKSDERQHHLEYVLEQIEDDISDGHFADAKNKAYTLTFDPELSNDRSQYWSQKQQDVLSQIYTASGGDYGEET